MTAWNRCDNCGKFIAYADFGNGAARRLVTPDSEFSREEYETLCKKCSQARVDRIRAEDKGAWARISMKIAEAEYEV